MRFTRYFYYTCCGASLTDSPSRYLLIFFFVLLFKFRLAFSRFPKHQTPWNSVRNEVTTNSNLFINQLRYRSSPVLNLLILSSAGLFLFFFFFSLKENQHFYQCCNYSLILFTNNFCFYLFERNVFNVPLYLGSAGNSAQIATDVSETFHVSNLF